MKAVLIDRVFGLRDTPHRIALGVALGLMIAFTPTLGVQIALYLFFATLLGANRFSGMPLLFISNPISAVPFYYFCWSVGSYCLNFGLPESGAEGAVVTSIGTLVDHKLGTQIWTPSFWTQLGSALLSLSTELWVGSMLLGVCTGLPGYFLSRWAVGAYRARSGNHASPEQGEP
ncbi:MAG: DUF2062 domain-containing protein [Myxococcota bacterium]